MWVLWWVIWICTPITLHTAVSLHIGTTTTLIKLGLSDAAMKTWIGWAPGSSIWLGYAHNPTFFDGEVDFICKVFRQALLA